MVPGVVDGVRSVTTANTDPVTRDTDLLPVTIFVSLARKTTTTPTKSTLAQGVPMANTLVLLEQSGLPIARTALNRVLGVAGKKGNVTTTTA